MPFERLGVFRVLGIGEDVEEAVVAGDAADVLEGTSALDICQAGRDAGGPA